MNIKELKKKLKEDMGWKWYWLQFTLLFDLDHQYQKFMMRRHIYHARKVDYWIERQKAYFAKHYPDDE